MPLSQNCHKWKLRNIKDKLFLNCWIPRFSACLDSLMNLIKVIVLKTNQTDDEEKDANF